MAQDNFFKSKWFGVGIFCLAELALIFIVFRLGMAVGFSKANFNYRWGENYHQLFGGPRGGWFMGQGGPGMMGGRGFGRDNFIAPHGVVGTVIKVDTSTVMVKDLRTNNELSLLITPNTTIRRGDQSIKISDIKLNDRVVVIGAPSSTGQTEVQLMRVFEQ